MDDVLSPSGLDVESGPSHAASVLHPRHSNNTFGDEDDEEFDDPFDIAHTKHAPLHHLRRWRQAALVLNAFRRFRYTLDLQSQEAREKRRGLIRAHAQVIRAALLFKLAGEQAIGMYPTPIHITICFVISGDIILSFHILLQGKKKLDSQFIVDGLSKMLNTHLDKGIIADDDELSKRRSTFGSNTYPVKKGKSFWRFLWESWQDLTLIILVIAAIASLVLGIKTEGIKEGWYDGGSISFAVLLVIFVTATSDYRQSLQFQNLNEQKRNIHVEVIRGGRREKISIYELVVGDVLPLSIGDQVQKDLKKPFLMSGCKVADGTGTMLVTGVGLNTEWGLLMASISEDNGEETPLQVRLNGIATFIGIVGLTVALAVLVILLTRYFTGNTKNADGSIQFQSGKTSVSKAVNGVIKIVTDAVTIVVVAVPEGLPLAVTLTSSCSMIVTEISMQVRRLSACETMGSATTICSDKTGTLTLNQSGMEFDSVKSECTVLHVSPFNSTKKRGGVALQRQTDSQVHIHWKGAAEIILGCCKKYLNSDGSVQPIDNEVGFYKNAIEDMAAKSLRCVAIAYKKCEIDQIPNNEENMAEWDLPEDDLVLVAIVGIKDPCRPGVKDAVKLCSDAGVKVRMVTGDNIQTAKAIALECGILASDADASEQIIEGKTFRELSEQKREKAALRISAIYQIMILLVFQFHGESILNLKDDGTGHAKRVKNTLIFNGFVFCQIFNEFNARKPDELNVFTRVLKNRLFVGIVGATFVLQIIIVECLGKFTDTVKLDYNQWLLSLAMGIFSWPLAVIGKFIPVPKTPLGKVFSKPYRRLVGSRKAYTPMA
ncbi:hypothetical protein AG4045_009983 [Apium graveolens]|uniref:Cation-transporting P-type ATPase N-terminal domain-containing protein n=1 Tax=Apium graveolens TaxID=4045 RepID=A0A6L5B7H7_APIGR|nr:hypothetical protein AG4045_009983 [Apium graveolens]